MWAQRLSDKNTAKWARRLDLPLRRMWSFGGYTFSFVTDDHRHGWVDTKTNEVEWDTGHEGPPYDGHTVRHFTSCHEMFPDWHRQTAPA